MGGVVPFIIIVVFMSRSTTTVRRQGSFYSCSELTKSGYLTARGAMMAETWLQREAMEESKAERAEFSVKATVEVDWSMVPEREPRMMGEETISSANSAS